MNLNFPSESFIEDYVYKKTVDSGVCPIIDERVDICLKQQNLNPYGVSDLIYVNADISPFDMSVSVYITVLELKNEQLKPKDIGQLLRYMKAVDKICRRYRRSMDFNLSICGHLSGLYNDDLDFYLMIENTENVSASFLSASLDEGFCVKNLSDGYFRTGQSFRSTSDSARDIFDHISESFSFLAYKKLTDEAIKDGED